MNRLESIRQELTKRGLCGMLITSGSNLRYVTGFTGGVGFALLTADGARLFVDGRYTTEALETAPGFEVITYKSKPYDMLKEYGLARLAYEPGAMTVASYERLKEALPECEFADGADVISKLRAIKDDGELSFMRTAAAIADATFSHMLTFIKEGMTEYMIALEIERYMLYNGADKRAFEPIAVSGERSALPHGQPGKRVIQRGDLLTMDFGCQCGGYCSDMTRTVAIGEIDSRKRAIYDAVLQSQLSALSQVKAGLRCKEADAVARDSLKEAGYADYFTHSLGHGVGLDVHEAPTLSYNAADTDLLESGMVVTIEPGVYIQGLGGVRIEDMVQITREGCINFVTSSKDLIII